LVGLSVGVGRSVVGVSVGSVPWVVDKTLPGRKEAALKSAISHAVGLDFPHHCDHNNAGNTQADELDRISGTHRVTDPKDAELLSDPASEP